MSGSTAPSREPTHHSSGLDLPPLPLPQGVLSKYIPVNDLVVHFLDAGPADAHAGKPKPPLLVLLHGFPELAYSWRNVLRPLADMGYRVVAPDRRGFGRTVPAKLSVPYPYTYEGPIAPFRIANLAQDVVALVSALGYNSVECVMGHDMGSPVAGACALVRPDIFRSVVMMASPFPAAPSLPFNVPAYNSMEEALLATKSGASEMKTPNLQLDFLLAHMNPPRMHYQHYYSLPQANEHMHKALTPSELRTFLRSYYHIKSACWSPSDSEKRTFEVEPRPLKEWSMEEAALLPPYYLMPRGRSMVDVVNEYRPEGADLEKARAWLSDEELNVYAAEYGRTGFQGGLNSYRCFSGLGNASDTLDSISLSMEDAPGGKVHVDHLAELALYAGKKVEVPTLFVAGEMDWGPFQGPGALAQMRSVCTHMDEPRFAKDAGHWVQQEAPQEVVQILQEFLAKHSADR